MAELLFNVTVRFPFWWKPYLHVLAALHRFGLLRTDTAHRHVEKVATHLAKRACDRFIQP